MGEHSARRDERDPAPPSAAASPTSAPTVVHETVLTYYPNRTIRGRVPCLLRWHSDNTIDAITIPRVADDHPSTIFRCTVAELQLVSWLTTIWVFHVHDHRYKIGLGQKAAVVLGASSGLVVLTGPAAAVAATSVISQARRLDRWWPARLKQAGVRFRISPVWILMGVALVALLVVILVFVPTVSS